MDSNPSSSEDSDDNEIQTCELTRSANESMHELDANVSDVQIENQEQEIWEQNIEQQGSSVSDVLNSPETEPFKTPNTKEGTEERPSKQHLSAPKAAKKSSKLVDTVNTSTSAKEAFEMMKSVYQKTQTIETRDKYSILGELVGHTIRNLKTDFAKATVEHQIHNILYDAQIGKYDFPQHSSLRRYYSYTSSSDNSVPSASASPHSEETHTYETNDGLSWAITNSFGTNNK
ncbi:unnamed protein product [Acanthoscelides obtectus]|uniref:Uncharacterized protein n=1 Tax=Acanthoscelides obtectus TaxID=200917 RepID=A0A9P0M005_ACAOB|nr:unnamed protein product [Acanthoscelides obtectus]CAK1624687.1 hypothetical protein AOBTE_LOCUS2699 [Acanthoscelides obtectus]